MECRLARPGMVSRPIASPSRLGELAVSEPIFSRRFRDSLLERVKGTSLLLSPRNPFAQFLFGDCRVRFDMKAGFDLGKKGQ